MPQLYIFRFLHQTTTLLSFEDDINSCISFASYIKPQLTVSDIIPYCVVYLSLPTSNHNLSCIRLYTVRLYIFRFLHQTTTVDVNWSESALLYIFRFLHQTTTSTRKYLSIDELYIFRFLHQTTTGIQGALECNSCISFASYIKPQQPSYKANLSKVVYLSLPTSNHNG